MALTFYGCIMPPYLFSRKIVRQHTFIAWENFKYYFDRTGTSKIAIQDKQLNKLLHWSSRNLILLPGRARTNFLKRVKVLYITGLFACFALWWYMELLPKKELCENSAAFHRTVPRDYRTGTPQLDRSAKMMNLTFKPRSFVSKTRNFVLNRMNLSARWRRASATCR